MFLLDGDPRHPVLSASDLTVASACEFAFLRGVDAKLGRADKVDDSDPMLERAASLGTRHELTVLDEYRHRFGAGVVEFPHPGDMSRATLERAASDTADALRSGADVIYQGTFFDGDFVGFADFIVRQPDGAYRVHDTKLARRAKVTALLQLAAYVDQLDAIGIRTDPTVELILGDGSRSAHAVDDILPVYRLRFARLREIVADRLSATTAVEWGDPRYTLDGRCPTCELEVAAHRDLLLVAGMRLTQRERLLDAGITTIDELAEAPDELDVELPAETFESLRAQAALQVRAPDAGADDHAVPPFEVRDAAALAAIPPPSDGDVYFDFEGDPLYTEDGTRWGIDYLFGLIEPDGTYRAWWAHTLAEERAALQDFLDYIAERRTRHPDMHIYHYASYERTHLLSMAARHGIGEEAVDDLLREHVLVDLYPIVKRGVRVGSRSYSIKKLEPLYMTGDRSGYDVTGGADSIEEYVAASALRDAGDLAGWQEKLDAIADYNEYDCVSTRELTRWLRDLADEHGVVPGIADTPEPDDVETSPLAARLLERAGDATQDRTGDEIAAALAAAAIDYHRREAKSFWWAHYSRLISPVSDWVDTRDVFCVDTATVVRDWHREGRQRSDHRITKLTGSWAPGSSAGAGPGPFALYDQPAPFTNAHADVGARSWKALTILEADADSVLIDETLPADAEPYSDVPLALTPAPPPKADNLAAAIAEWAQHIVDKWDAADSWPRDALVDVLRRIPPRTRAGGLAPLASEDDYCSPVVDSILRLNDSYLAVQGPPGTGKTWLASRVIAELVRSHGWRVGVVAQSHAVVENVLNELAGDAGLDPDLVAKAPKTGTSASTETYTVLGRDDDIPDFTREREHSGYVIGGTAWTFANTKRVPRRSLDLLVVDEAGQFSLASTIAASVSARNVLFLGDPQQLPQVSQGTHPEPVDTSALGWIADGHDVLPTELGYFLASSRRMHPEVADPVSHLSYAGELHSHPCTLERRLDGVDPGLHPILVEHHGNATSSPEEADAVLALVRNLLGAAWTAHAEATTRPLEERDLIVITPYNAQQALVAETLAEAGFDGVRVGTVDKFQGQQAAVSIVTLAASSAADVPRGMEFLIMPNRLNVAISRAQWAAYLLYSPALLDHLPATPDALAHLSGFIRLVQHR